MTEQTLPEAYLLIEVPQFGRSHVFRYQLKHDVTKIGAESGINQVVIRDDAVAGQHLEIIYAEGLFFLRRVVDAAVTLDGRFMDSPSEELHHETVIEIDRVRLTFLSGYASVDTVLFLNIRSHEAESPLSFMTAMLTGRKTCVGTANCDLLLDDPSLKGGKLEFENFGPNAMLVKPFGKTDNIFLNDAGLTAMARMVPGDRMVLAEHSIGVDFMAVSILDNPVSVLSEDEIARYRLLPSDTGKK